MINPYREQFSEIIHNNFRFLFFFLREKSRSLKFSQKITTQSPIYEKQTNIISIFLSDYLTESLSFYMKIRKLLQRIVEKIVVQKSCVVLHEPWRDSKICTFTVCKSNKPSNRHKNHIAHVKKERSEKRDNIFTFFVIFVVKAGRSLFLKQTESQKNLRYLRDSPTPFLIIFLEKKVREQKW